MDQQDVLSSVYPSKFESSPEHITSLSGSRVELNSTIASSSAYRITNSGTLYTSSPYSAASQDGHRYGPSIPLHNEVLRYPQSAQRVSSNSAVADYSPSAGSPYVEKQPPADRVLHHPSHEPSKYYEPPHPSTPAAAHYAHPEATNISGYNDSLKQYHDVRLHDLNTRRHQDQLKSTARGMQHLSALQGNGSTTDTSGEASTLPAASQSGVSPGHLRQSHSDVLVQEFKTQHCHTTLAHSDLPADSPSMRHLVDSHEASIQSQPDGSGTMSMSHSIPMYELFKQSGSQRQQDTQYHQKTFDHAPEYSRFDSFPQHHDQHLRSNADVQFTHSAATRRSNSPEYSTVNKYTEGDDIATVNDDAIGMSGYDHAYADTWPAPSPTSAGNDHGDFTSASSLKKKKKSKMHECTICYKKFPRPSGLKTHMNIHNNEKPFACGYPGCNRTFGVRSNAKRHMRTHGVYLTPSSSKASGSYVVGFDVPVIMPPQTDHVTRSLASGAMDSAPPPMHGHYDADGENSVYGAGEGEDSADEGDTDSTSGRRPAASASGRAFKVRWMPLKESSPFSPTLPTSGMVPGAPMPAPGPLYAHPEPWQGSSGGDEYGRESGDTLGHARSTETLGREGGRGHARMV